MLNINRIEGGLKWDDVDRLFTNTSLENGYERLDDYFIHCELNSNIICFDSREVIIDDILFESSDKLINFLYGGL
jgi:hypothetical protein